jgi:hypothetical protein
MSMCTWVTIFAKATDGDDESCSVSCEVIIIAFRLSRLRSPKVWHNVVAQADRWELERILFHIVRSWSVSRCSCVVPSVICKWGPPSLCAVCWLKWNEHPKSRMSNMQLSEHHDQSSTAWPKYPFWNTTNILALMTKWIARVQYLGYYLSVPAGWFYPESERRVLKIKFAPAKAPPYWKDICKFV